jgi:hypothetical protein
MARERDFIETGTRVRLKPGVRTISGRRGITATMLYPNGGVGVAIKDGGINPVLDSVIAALYQWAVMRDQTPNPEHVEAIRRLRHSSMS